MWKSYIVRPNIGFQIKWSNRLVGDRGAPAKISVDGTDFRTVEYKPFHSDRKSHKSNGPGLRYEIGIAVATGWIVHVFGPFPCGEYPDLRIARMYLHNKLPAGEYYIADDVYKAKHTPVVIGSMVPPHELKRFKKIRSRHENINGRFKEWDCLSKTYRHEEEKHFDMFMAVVVITQMEMWNGRPAYSI